MLNVNFKCFISSIRVREGAPNAIPVAHHNHPPTMMQRIFLMRRGGSHPSAPSSSSSSRRLPPHLPPGPMTHMGITPPSFQHPHHHHHHHHHPHQQQQQADVNTNSISGVNGDGTASFNPHPQHTMGCPGYIGGAAVAGAANVHAHHAPHGNAPNLDHVRMVSLRQESLPIKVDVQLLLKDLKAGGLKKKFFFFNHQYK